MTCTTILVGKNASYDGSTMIARTDDSGAGSFTPKKFVVLPASDQPPVYKSVLSHVEIPLPPNPMDITGVPNALAGKGLWAACGVNTAHVGMSATETITSNARVLGADPLVKFTPATATTPEVPGGIGEEDMVYLVLPYIHSAREGVERLGQLLETYGTYEKNGIAFQDLQEIWWLETIGGHHWLARRVPDDVYAVIPNQLGLDKFDLEDALTTKKDYMCSKDLAAFIKDNHLELSFNAELNPRVLFGSHSDADHVYNTPRAWFIHHYLNPYTIDWNGFDPEYTPSSDDLPWAMVPERKITLEDMKYLLSSHYQDMPFDPYGKAAEKGKYRPIGINRTSFTGLIQMRPYAPRNSQNIIWLSFGSNAFNAMVPCYANITTTPAYLSNTTAEVSTDNFYWSSRLLGAMADASFHQTHATLADYQMTVMSQGHELLGKYDKLLAAEKSAAKQRQLREQANEEIAAMVKKETAKTLDAVLLIRSNQMKNAYSLND